MLLESSIMLLEAIYSIGMVIVNYNCHIFVVQATDDPTYSKWPNPMKQQTFKNVNNCLNTNIYSYLETSGGQSSYLYLNVVPFLTPV